MNDVQAEKLVELQHQIVETKEKITVKKSQKVEFGLVSGSSVCPTHPRAYFTSSAIFCLLK
jgi:hypothetical protein